MVKKLLKAGTTLAILMGCYLGYVRAFDAIVRQFEVRRLDDAIAFHARNSRSKQQARDLARRAVGPDHWAVTGDKLPLAFYSSDRGFWFYAKDYKEVPGYDRKRLEVWPVLIVQASPGKKNLLTLTAESATLDLNQPIGLGNKPKDSEGVKVKRARIEGDVRIRDDRGTPDVPADDLKIGPMTFLIFDDDAQQITTEAHVIIQDPDQTITGDGLEIQLRKADAADATARPSSGFGGVEFAILKKAVRVALRDVGETGLLGSSPPPGRKGPASKETADVVVRQGAAGKDSRTAKDAVPVPLIVQADGPMRLDVPPEKKPVAVGPPEPPAPTLVRFDRNVVALHGRVNPNQLNCDTLRLTLVPAPQEDPKGAQGPTRRKPANDARPAEGPAPAATVATAPPADAQAEKGLFGDLTLQKAHATGHAVWLQMRDQGTKVRCSEMIHERGAAGHPDLTLFRGEKTRQVWMEKVDYVPEDPTPEGTTPAPDRPRKVKSVTHVVTVSATIYDRGRGMDLADVRAYGPGRLDSRPSLKEPVERIAVWQDELQIVNVVGDDGLLRQKQVTLTGGRPMFVDLLKKASLDSAQEIKVYLKPRPPSPTEAPAVAAKAAPEVRLASHAADEAPQPDRRPSDTGATSGLGGSLQIERLVALRDVHLLAPNRRMEARQWLDAPFIEVGPAPATEAKAPAQDDGEPDAQVAEAQPSATEEPKAEEPAKQAPAAAAVAAKDAPATPPAPVERTMTAVADRIWAKVALPRGKGLDAAKGPAPASGASKEPEADIREARLYGNVALHQDPAPDPSRKDGTQAKGSDVSGEMVYLDNKGEGKADLRVFHRDPNDPSFLPGPIRWARVSNDQMTVFGETLYMDQEKDKIWAYGPGILNQWTDRAVLSDRSPEAKPEEKAKEPPKPRTRAGRPIGDKDMVTISWTKQMEFTGRARDPSGNPSARADFDGLIDTKMTDATLHCEDHMIVFTDREVPLAQVGVKDPSDRAEDGRPKVEIALIYCFGKPTVINRKVDPELPIVNEQQRIDAWVANRRDPEAERLAYNRRTGEFYVPGAGMVFLYDRPEDKDRKRIEATDSQGRVVRPISGRAADRRPDAKLPTPPIRRAPAELVLMQVKFANGMKGRVGSGRDADTREERWSEFFGNIELVRSKVKDSALQVSKRQEVLSPDARLSEDGFYLTSQMLRIIQEPPPAGAPEGASARSFAKAWERVHINKGESMSIESDVVTYDSGTDVVWAYGEGENGVTMTQQHAPGQPPSVNTPRAVQYNLKSRTGRSIGSDVISLVDKRTGTRPSVMAAPDPTQPKHKKIREPFKVPQTNLERRGFTGY